MQAAASEWFARRTSAAADWPLSAVLATKGNRTVDVILPAQDEAATVGQIVTEVRESLMTPETALVDNLVVVDSGSTDATAEVARAAGARVVGAGDPLPNLPVRDGKGEAMWRGLAATDGDLVVFVDADLRSFSPEYVVSLLGPLLEDDEIQLVKAVYDRPLVVGETQIAAGGGRVTEIMARPLINALWPELAGVAQPLSGEYASRRDLLETLSFPCGYGVEIGLLVDTYRRFGLAGLAQVDLGERKHEHQKAVPDVPEHDRKEKGKGDDGEDGRIHLAIPGHPVRVHQCLKTGDDLVRFEVSGRVLRCVNLVKDRVHGRVGGEGGLLEGAHDVVAVGGRDPSLRHEALGGDVDGKLVQRVVDSLFAPHHAHPPVPVVVHAEEERAALVLARVDRRRQLAQTR